MANSQNKVQYDINKTCRTCLTDGNSLTSILNNYLQSVFTKFTNLELSESDGLPSKICSNCIEKLNSSFTFLDLCIKSDMILKQQKEIKSEIDEPSLENVQTSNESDLSVNNFLELNFMPKDENISPVDNKVKEESNCIQSDVDFVESDDNNEEYIEIQENKKKKRKIQEERNPISQNKRIPQEVELVTVCQTNPTSSELSDYNLYLICPKCDEEFSKSDRLEAHYRVHLGKKPEECHICNKEFKKLDRLENHILKHHPKCVVCREMFASKSSLREHKRTVHTVSKKYMCHICGKSFGKGIKTHMAQKHCDDKPFRCNLCPLAFKTAAVLKMHIMRHEGAKKYICSICGFGAVRKWELERHMNSHNDEKPFACKFCPNTYKRRQNLIAHCKVHTGERPYQCDLCSMSFREKKVLRNHRMLHTGEKPHVCSVCSKAFTQKVALISHMKVHK